MFTREVGKLQQRQVLIDPIKLKLKGIDSNFLQLLMKGVKVKLISIGDDGVFSYKK